jgi:hypothetical protein
MPVPPYTITFQPISSGTALVSQVIISRPLGASGVHEGSYDSSSQDIPVLKGTGQDIFSKGITNTLSAHRAPATGTSLEGCPGRTPPA